MAEVIVTGVTRFAEELKLTQAKASEAARKFVSDGALIIERHSKEVWRPRPAGSMRTSRTGRIYYDGNPPYKAERPYPTQRTGNTRNSIRRHYVRSVGVGKWESGTGPNTPYAGYVHFGTRYIHTPAFPFMTQGIERSKNELQTLAESVWEAAQE